MYCLKEMLIDALRTEGEHHKQWYLEQILRAIIGGRQADDIKTLAQWEEGKSP